MPQFTDRDIKALKNELLLILEQVYMRMFDVVQYIESKVMTQSQYDLISYEVRRSYPISIEPLPKTLQPLIEVAKLRLINKKTSPPKPKYAPSSSYNWEHESNLTLRWRSYGKTF
jgi:hypothetical protein